MRDFVRASVNFMSSYIRIQNFRKFLRHALKELSKVISHKINLKNRKKKLCVQYFNDFIFSLTSSDCI